MARQGKGVAATKHAEILLIITFALISGEVFLIYRNFRMPMPESELNAIPFFGGFVSVCTALAACIVMLFVYVAFGKRVGDERHLALALGCSIAGPVVSLVCGKYLGYGFAFVPGAVLTAVGCACFLPAIVRRIAGMGVRCSVWCSIASCLALLIVAPVSMLVPMEAFTLIMATLSLGVFACLRLLGPCQDELSSSKDEGQKLPRVLSLTIVVVGMMEGVTAVVDEVNMGPIDKMVVFSLAFIAAAALCAVVLLRMRISYNRALYRVCIPLVSVGLSLLVLDSFLALDMGTFLVLVGRQLFAASLLALVVYLSRYHGSDYYLLVLGVLIGAMVGNLVGLLLYQIPWPAGEGHLISPVLLVLVLVFSLVISLYLMDESNMRTHWGMIAVDDVQETPGLTLDQSCEALGIRRGLTQRELDVVKHIVRGRDRHAIAERLFISEGTVKVHMRNIYQKLDIHSKQELITLVEDVGESVKG